MGGNSGQVNDNDDVHLKGGTDDTLIGNTTDKLKVDGSGVTQPVSAASLPLPTGAATAANQTTANSSLSSIDAGIPAALGQTTMVNSMPVAIASDQSAIQHVGNVASGATDSGNPLKTGGVFNTTQPTVTNGQRVDTQSTARGANIVATGTDNFNINNVSGTVSLPTGAATSANQSTEITSLQLIDDLPHSNDAALSKGIPIMGQLDDTSTTSVTEDHVAPVRITAARAAHVNLRNNAGTEVGTSTTPIRTDPTGTTTQPVNVSSITLSAGQVPTFSDKLVVDVTTTPISVTNSVTYTTIYTYSGTGLLIGFNHEYANVSIVPKLVIDGNIVFDGTDISTFNGFLFTANTVDRRQNGQGIVTLSAAIDFSLRQPIRFTTSVVISARLTSGSTAHNFTQGVVFIQKDT